MQKSRLTKGRVGRAWIKLTDFIAEAPGSLRGHLNVEELARVAISALAGGGGVFGILNLIVVYAGLIFPAPADAGPRCGH